MTDLLGKTLGQYTIVSVLGKGGMATVYRAVQTSMDREVAIKVMSGQIVGNADFIARFDREVRVISRLQHPHILPVYDYGRDGEIIYLVMRLVDGGSLDQRLRAGALPIGQAAPMFGQIASALNYAHRQGIVHRDLKPNNILLDSNNMPYLMDFGIAKMVESQTRLTATGTIMGTPAYMAPEQWRAEELDGRTDIYALGIMLYEMLTGKLPFKGETPFSMMYQHMDAQPPSPLLINPDLPEGITRVIEKAMAKRKEDRYPSADEFAEAVNATLSGSPSRTLPAAPAEPRPRTTKVVPADGDVGTLIGSSVDNFNPPAAPGPGNAPRVLLVSRADETQPVVERLYKRLCSSFGSQNIFQDISALAVGQKDRSAVDKAVRACDALLILIGPNWLNTAAADGSQALANPEDPVLLQIEAALRGRNIQVIPVLVSDAVMPAASVLPASISVLATKDSFPLRGDSNFDTDAKWLIKEIEDATGKNAERNTGAQFVSTQPVGALPLPVAAIPRPLLIGAAVVIGAILLIGAFSLFSRQPVVTPTAIAAPPSALPSATTTPPPTATPITPTVAAVAPSITAGMTVSIPAVPATASVTLAPATTVATLTATSAPPTVITATTQAASPQAPTASVPPMQPATAAASTPSGPIITVFRGGDSLTLYVPGSGTVNLAGLTIEAQTAQGNRLSKRLDQFPSFIGLPFNKIQAPVCFHLQNSRSAVTPPLECRQIPANQLFIQNLTAANIIWYDTTAAEARPVFLSQNTTSLGQCPATLAQCDIVLANP